MFLKQPLIYFNITICLQIATNLCTFLCSDNEFTPRILIGSACDPFDGILTLNNRQRYAERIAYNRGTSAGSSCSRGPGRPPATELPLEELLACDEPEARAARTRRRGATFALKAIGSLIHYKIIRGNFQLLLYRIY